MNSICANELDLVGPVRRAVLLERHELADADAVRQSSTIVIRSRAAKIPSVGGRTDQTRRRGLSFSSDRVGCELATLVRAVAALGWCGADPDSVRFCRGAEPSVTMSWAASTASGRPYVGLQR
jgi:hypothetical protein